MRTGRLMGNEGVPAEATLIVTKITLCRSNVPLNLSDV